MSSRTTTACLVINDGPSKETLQELKATVMAVLGSNNAEAVKIKALEVLQGAVVAVPKTISNCNFKMDA
jgi:hypothetical protein